MIFKKLLKPFRSRRAPVFWMPTPLAMSSSPSDRQAVEKAYARLFSTDDGKAVLTHLQTMTFARAYPADAPDTHLRYAEGQRALVGSMLRLISAGRQ